MSNKPIYDEKGKVIGYQSSDGTYVKPTGEVIARVRNGSTYNDKGQVKGKGDQALKLF